MKQTRDQLDQELLAYIDGRLDPGAAARVEVYLANTDPDMAAKVAGMIADREALRALPRLRAPHDLAERVMERVERGSLLGDAEKHPSIAPRRWYHHHLALAAGLLLVLGLFAYFIINSVMHTNSPWEKNNNLASSAPIHGTPATPLPIVAQKKGADALPIAPEDAKAGVAATNLEGKAGSVADAAPPNSATPPDNEQVVAKTVALANSEAAGEINPTAANFNGVANSAVALSSVRATPHDYVAGPPVIITLRARDAADYQRLRSLIAHFLETDPRTAQRQVALVTRLNAYDNNNNDSNVNAQAPGAPNSQKDQLQNAAEQQAAARNAGQAEPNRDQGAVSYQFAGPVQALADNAHGAERANLQHLASEEYANAKSGPRLQNTVAFLGDNSAPYRVFLKPEQLNEITSQFAVHSITRGDTGYVIGNLALGNSTRRLNYAVANNTYLNTGNTFVANGAGLNNAGGNVTLNGGSFGVNTLNTTPGNQTVNNGTTNFDGVTQPSPANSTLTANGTANFANNAETQRRPAGAALAKASDATTTGEHLADSNGKAGAAPASGGGGTRLSGANTYSGGTAITGGSLALNAPATSPDAVSQSPAAPAATPPPGGNAAYHGPMPAPAVAAAPRPAAAAPSASLRANDKLESPARADEQQRTVAAGQTAAPTAQAPIGTPAPAVRETRPAGQWVECIISMIPPAPVAAPAPANTLDLNHDANK